MSKWQPVDILVACLVVALCFMMSLSAIKPFVTGEEMGTDKAKMVAGLIGSIISIISMYVGAKMQKRADN